jgi:hypothetical protein
MAASLGRITKEERVENVLANIVARDFYKMALKKIRDQVKTRLEQNVKSRLREESIQSWESIAELLGCDLKCDTKLGRCLTNSLPV